MKKISLFIFTALFSTPLLALAAPGTVNVQYVQGYANSITGIINSFLVPVLIAIAFIVFLWGIYKYFIYGAANESEKAEGRTFAMWGIIGFVIILSLWGIVNIFMSTLGLSASTAPPYPTLPTGTAVPSPGGAITGNGPGVGTGGIAAPSSQNAALNTQYNNMQNTCNTNGSLSTACQQAQSSYLQNYNAANPGTASYQTCMANGGDPAICQCEASGGVWNLTDQVCSNSSTGGNSSGSGTPNDIQTCINNGSSRAVCECEASGGVWSLSDNTCSTDSTGGTSGGTSTGGSTSGGTVTSAYQTCVDNGGEPAVCQCESSGGAWSTTDNTCSQ